MGQKVRLKFGDKPTIAEYIGIIVMFFASRSIVLWADLGAALAYEFFFAYSIFLFLTKRGHLIGKNSKIYAIGLVLAISINRFVFNPNILGNMWIANVLVCISSLLFYASYEFANFRRCFLSVLSFILLFNIPLHLFDVLIGWPWVKTTYIDEFHEGRMFLIYNLGKGRLCGIWGEPGVTQIFINSAFMMYIPKIRAKTCTKKEVLELIILLVALLLGTSTMGYLVCAAIVFSVFYSSFRYMSLPKKLFTIPIVACAILLLVFSPAVQDKFGEGKDSGGSFGQRYSDNMACLAMALDRPLTGYGFGTREYEAISVAYDNFSSSNGVLAFAARIGIWWILVYIIFITRAMKRMDLGVPMLFLLLLILMMEFDEDFIEFPMSFFFLMNFGYYRDSKS